MLYLAEIFKNLQQAILKILMTLQLGSLNVEWLKKRLKDLLSTRGVHRTLRIELIANSRTMNMCLITGTYRDVEEL